MGVDIETLVKDYTLMQNKEIIQKDMCKHYKELILKNSNINDIKAKKISTCSGMIIFDFFATINLSN